MPIKDLARTDVIAVPPETDITSVAELMEENSVGSVIIVEDDQPVGLITDRDLALNVVGRAAEANGLAAADVMTADLFTIDADGGIYETLNRATEASVRRIPIVEDDGSLAGIVTLDDLIVLLASEFGEVSEIVQAESPPY